MFLSCKYLKASAKARIIFFECFSEALNPGWSFKYEFNEIPDKNYIIKFTWLFVSTTSQI